MNIKKHLTPGNMLATAMIGWFLLRHSSLHLPEGVIIIGNGLVATIFLAGLLYWLVCGTANVGRVFLREKGDKTAQN